MKMAEPTREVGIV